MIYLTIGGVMLALLGGLYLVARSSGRAEEILEEERRNAEAAARIADAEAQSSRDSTVLLDQLRDGIRKL